MKHAITNAVGTNLPQMMLGTRHGSPTSTKATKPFPTVEPNVANSIAQPQIPQAVTTLNSSENLQSLGSNTNFKQGDARGTGSPLSSDLLRGLTRLKNSLGNPGYFKGEPAVASSRPRNTAPPLFEQPGSQALRNDGPGSLLNVLG